MNTFSVMARIGNIITIPGLPRSVYSKGMGEKLAQRRVSLIYTSIEQRALRLHHTIRFRQR